VLGFEPIKQAVWPPGSADTVCPRPSVTLTFDRLTLKLVCESHLKWETFTTNLGMQGHWVLELFAMYATDRQTGRQTQGQTDGQKQRLLHNNACSKRPAVEQKKK